MTDKWWEWQMRPGDPVMIGETTLTPQSRALVMRFPFGGLVWNRPTSVLVTKNGNSEEIPVVDVTRTAVLALAAIGVIIPLILKLFRGGK